MHDKELTPGRITEPSDLLLLIIGHLAPGDHPVLSTVAQLGVCEYKN